MSTAANTVLGGNSSDSRVRKKSKGTIGEEYVAKIRATKNLPAELCLADDELVKLQEHFKLLPQRYAVDVNTLGYDPLFHFMLLQRARQQPDAMHFSVKLLDQLRPDYEECSRAFGARNDILKDSMPSGSPEGALPLLQTANAPAFQIGTPQSYGNLQVRVGELQSSPNADSSCNDFKSGRALGESRLRVTSQLCYCQPQEMSQWAVALVAGVGSYRSSEGQAKGV